MPTPRTRPWLVGVAALGLVAGTAALTTTARAAISVIRVSESTTETQAQSFSQDGVVSGDGRYVAFTSAASDLVAEDADQRLDVYLRDLVNGTTELVSVGTTGKAGGGTVNDVSADGRYVVFTSRTADVVTNDVNGVDDVFIRDRVAGTTERVSVADNGEQARQPSTDGSVSRDGRYVTFTTFARLVPEDRDSSSQDVYVRDLVSDSTELVSVTRTGNEGGGKEASISDNGRFISFTSKGKLVKGDSNKAHDVFVRDLRKDKTVRVSVSSKGAQAGKPSFESEIAGRGRFIVFSSNAGNLVNNDKNKKLDVFVHDRKKAKTELASVNSREKRAGGPTVAPTISADGRYVAFHSSSNLVKGGGNVSSLYLRDREAGRTELLLSNVQNGASISGDGHALSFSTFSGDFVTGDTNGTTDVFLYTW